MASQAAGPNLDRRIEIQVPPTKAYPALPDGDPFEFDSDSENEEVAIEFKVPDPVRAKYRKEAQAQGNTTLDESGETRPVKLGKYKVLPEQFKFKETDRVYSIVDPVIHRNYRGEDIRHFPWFTENTKSKERFFAMVAASFYDGGNLDRIEHWGANKGCTIKQGLRLMVKPNLDTQWPSLSIFVKRDNGTSVECRSYGSECTYFSVNVPGKVTEWWFEDGSEQEKQNAANKLLQFEFEFKPNGEIAWGGITQDEINAMDQEWVKQHPADDILVSLSGASQAQACITLDDGVDPSSFAKYFEALMDTACKHGNLWFWRLQHPEQPLSVRNFMLEGPDWAPPRWMVKEWLAIRSKDGTRVEEVVPLKWATFREPGVWPKEEITNAIYRLDLARTRPINDVALRESLDKQSGDIISRWEPYKQVVDENKKKGYYLVHIWCSFATSSINGKTICPEKDTPVVIRVVGDNGRFHRGKYHGFVVPDIMMEDSSFVAFVYGDTEIPERYSKEGNGVRISVDIDINSVSIDRQMGALIEMDRLVKARKPDSQQIDFSRFFLGTPATRGTYGKFAAHMEPAQKEAITQFNLNRGSNEQQMAFVHEVCTNKDGVVYLNGPPGTGKSRTIANMAHSIIDTSKFHRQGQKQTVLVTAPTNKAVESLLSKLVEDDPDCKKRVIVHFQGASSKTGKGHETAERSVPKELPRDADSALWEMLDHWSSKDAADGDLAKYSFQRVFRAWYTAIAEDKEPKDSTGEWLREMARKYARATRKLGFSDKQLGAKAKSGDATSAGKLEREKARDDKNEVEKQLMLYFFNNVVDIVCCTMSMAGHPTLRDCCHATFAFLDEAGIAVTPDLLTAIVANFSTLEGVVLAGDHNQQKPMVQNQGQNEFAQVHAASLLEDIAVHEELKGKLPLMSRIVLQQQYRMTPDLMNLLNRLVYKNQLIAAPSVLADKPEATLAKEVFSGLGPCFKSDWSYLAVSVSGEEVSSGSFTNTTSLINEVEAEAVVQTAKKLVMHEGSEMSDVPGQKIKPRNILVITPYSGQAALLWTRFKEEGLITDVEAESARINSFAQIQGDEAPIVLVSFCTNNPGRELAIQFAVEEHGFTVAISRAMAYMVLFANWKTWEEAKINKVKGFFPNRRFKMLHEFLELLCEQEDPADCRIVSTDNYNTFLYENKQPDVATFLDSIVRRDPGEASSSSHKRKRPASGFQIVESGNRHRFGQYKKTKGQQGQGHRGGMFSQAFNTQIEKAIEQESTALEAELAALTTMPHSELVKYLTRWPEDSTHQKLAHEMKKMVMKKFLSLLKAKPLEKQPDEPGQPRVNTTEVPKGRFLPKKDDRDLPSGPGLRKEKQPAVEAPKSVPKPSVQMPAAAPASIGYAQALSSKIQFGKNQVVQETFRKTKGSGMVVLASKHKTGQPGPHTQPRADGHQILGAATGNADIQIRGMAHGASDARLQPESEDVCEECGERGHLARFCTSRRNTDVGGRGRGGRGRGGRGRGGRGRGNGGGRGGGFSGTVTCYKCRQTGHISRACPNQTGGS